MILRNGKRMLSFFLALVMILSAFAGTFTISAEGEEAPATTPWKVGETAYATFEEAYNAVADGGTIQVTENAKTGFFLMKKNITLMFQLFLMEK